MNTTNKDQTMEEFKRFLENKYRTLITESRGSLYTPTDTHHLYARIDAMVALIDEFEKIRETAMGKSVDISDIAAYIKNDSVCLIPVDKMFNADGTHITKNQYGKVLLDVLAQELIDKYG